MIVVSHICNEQQITAMSCGDNSMGSGGQDAQEPHIVLPQTTVRCHKQLSEGVRERFVGHHH